MAGLLAAALILPRLGEQHLWQDEAQTALVARTILTTGLPRGTDGRNFFSQEDGAEYGPGYVWDWHPWLSFYVLAFFFACFGQGTAVARLPFALFGVATVLLAYAFVRRRWRSPGLALLSAALLSLNVTYVLLSRQCRFYSMGAFFALWALDAYLGVLERRRRASIQLVVALVLLLHTFHFFYAALAAALALHTILFSRKNLARTFSLLAASVALNLPWLFVFNPFSFFSHHSPSAARVFHASLIAERAVFYLWGFLHDGLTIPLGLIGAAAWILRRRRTGRWFGGETEEPYLTQEVLIVYILCQLGLATALAPDQFLRYLGATWAPGSILAASVAFWMLRLDRALGWALIATALVSRPVGGYLYELSFGGQGTVDWLVDFFQKNGRPDETVLVNYEDMPLKFYTPMRVLGGLTGEDLSPAARADWVVVLQPRYVPINRMAAAEFISRRLDLKDYRAIQTGLPDSMKQNREEPSIHLFRTPEGPPYLVIFRRVSPGK